MGQIWLKDLFWLPGNLKISELPVNAGLLHIKIKKFVRLKKKKEIMGLHSCLLEASVYLSPDKAPVLHGSLLYL